MFAVLRSGGPFFDPTSLLRGDERVTTNSSLGVLSLLRGIETPHAHPSGRPTSRLASGVWIRVFPVGCSVAKHLSPLPGRFHTTFTNIEATSKAFRLEFSSNVFDLHRPFFSYFYRDAGGRTDKMVGSTLRDTQLFLQKSRETGGGETGKDWFFFLVLIAKGVLCCGCFKGDT